MANKPAKKTTAKSTATKAPAKAKKEAKVAVEKMPENLTRMGRKVWLSNHQKK